MKDFKSKIELEQHLALDIWYYGWEEPDFFNQKSTTLGVILNGTKCLATINPKRRSRRLQVNPVLKRTIKKHDCFSHQLHTPFIHLSRWIGSPSNPSSQKDIHVAKSFGYLFGLQCPF